MKIPHFQLWAHQCAVIVAATIVFSCHAARSESQLTIIPDYLKIVGKCVDTKGSDRPSVGISLEAKSLGKNRDDGSFELVLEKPDLENFRKNHPDGKAQLTFVDRSVNPILVGSTSVNLGAEGTQDVSEVTLNAAATVTGMIKNFSNKPTLDPIAGAVISYQSSTTKSDAQGRFTLDALPAGNISIDINADGKEPTSVSIQLAAGQTRALDAPVILFPKGSVDGTFELAATPSNAELVASGHPFRRSFRVVASPLVKWFRYSNDINIFSQEGAGGGPNVVNINPNANPNSNYTVGAIVNGASAVRTSPWRPISDSFDFDFLQNGTQTMYIQFADATVESQQASGKADVRPKVSDVHTLVVPVDMFTDTDGFVIEDGSGTVYKRLVTLRIDLPAIARYMRYTVANEMGNETQPFTGNDVASFFPAKSVLQIPILDAPNLNSRNDAPLVARRTVFLQFSDNGITVSGIYKQSVSVILFPNAPFPQFLIEGGASTTQSRFVRLDIQVPDNAVQMQIMDHADAGNTSFVGTWMDVAPVHYFYFASQGMKTLDLQFRDRAGFSSPFYQQSIRVLAFPPSTSPGFAINDGAPSTFSPNVVLTLNPPPNAQTFTVSEFEPSGSSSGGSGIIISRNGSLSSSSSTVFNLVPYFPFQFTSAGVHTLTLQYQDIDGNASGSYAQTISVEPFPPGSADFMINQGASITNVPLLHLDILPPPSAQFMSISESNPQIWIPVKTSYDYKTAGRGLKNIQIYFKNLPQDDPSPAITRSIYFDPFPDYGAFSFAGGALGADGIYEVNVSSLSMQITIPPAAAEMSIQSYVVNSGGTLSTAPQEVPVTTRPLKLDEHAEQTLVCLTFFNLDNNASTPVCHAVRLNLWPANFLSLAINGGAATTTSNHVTLTLNPPPAATGVIFSESPSTPDAATARTVQTSMTFDLSTGTGLKTVYGQYVTAKGTFSPVFSAQIQLN